MHDIAEFLGGRDPFRGLDERALEELAARTEVEFFAAGSEIGQRDEVVRMVRRGSVELLDDGRAVDLVTEGELIGLPSALSGLPVELTARAAEDALTYALPGADVLALVGGEAATIPYAAGGELARRPVRTLVRRLPVSCPPDTPIREAARRMGEHGVSSILIRGAGEPGIVTDRDLRSRVIAGSTPLERPVREVMSTPLITVDGERTVADATLAMLENDIRHIAVTSGSSRIIGVISDGDLLAAESRTPFVLRRAIREAASKDELRAAAGPLRDAAIAMHRADLPAARIIEAISTVTDALTRRMIELAVEALGEPPAEFAWLAMGSHGRREPTPSSDVDSGMAWREASTAAGQGSDADEIARYMRSVATDVADCMRELGWRLDPHGVTATGEFSASSAAAWRESIEDWLSRPADEGVLIALSITLDGRVVHGPRELDPKRFLLEDEDRSRLSGIMLRSALASKPPTGFLRDIVLEHTGEHRGAFDIKLGGLIPVVDLARYAALEAGASDTSTVGRLRAAADAGTIDPARARSLEQAYELFINLRLDHQIGQLERGEAPDDHLDPKQLDHLTRRYLRDAFREVAAIQRSLESELQLTRGRI